jgi:hypothetical protein
VVAAGPGILPRVIPSAGAVALAGAGDDAVTAELRRLSDDALVALNDRANILAALAYVELHRRQRPADDVVTDLRAP